MVEIESLEGKGTHQDLVFVTSNPNKFMEVRRILEEYGITFERLDLRYPEIQSKSLRQIASTSANYLCERLKRPLFVEDSGLFIDALKGFPGPYSSYVQATIGNLGILKLMEGVQQRVSRFESVVAYVESVHETHLFMGVAEGSISTEAKGEKWGFDPIFIPLGSNQTYAEMGIVAKTRISHRRAAFGRFAEWIRERGQEDIITPSG